MKHVVYKAFYSHGTYFAAVRENDQGCFLTCSKMERVVVGLDAEVKEELSPLYVGSHFDSVFSKKVDDVKEISQTLYNLETSKLCRLFYASKTPEDETRSNTNPQPMTVAKYLEPVPGPGSASPYLGRLHTTGYMVENHEDSRFMNKMTDLASHMIPTDACTQRRYIIRQ